VPLEDERIVKKTCVGTVGSQSIELCTLRVI